MRRALGRWSFATALSGVVLAASLTGAWTLTRGADTRDPVVSSAAAVPAGSGTLDITVWDRLPSSIDDASLQGLTNRSVVASLSDETERLLGWSASDLEWEVFARTNDGEVTVLDLGALDGAEINSDFVELGQKRGEGWSLADSNTTSNTFVETFRYGRVLTEQNLLIAAATPEGLDRTVSTVRGRSASILDDRAVADLIDGARGQASVMVQAAAAWCAETGVLDEADYGALQSVAQQNGKLADPTWGARSVDSRTERIVFANAFESADVARRQSEAREPLTTGTFIGRFGEVAESLIDPQAFGQGSVTGFEFTLTDEAEDFMADAGQVVFNGCAVTPP